MRLIWVCGALVLLALVLGCLESSPVASDHEHEKKVLELANRHAEQQSVQAKQMADIQKQWQTERTDLNTQRDQLETERQDIALQRQREPLIAESIKQVGILTLCLLPLIIAGLLLRKSNEPENGNVIAETLVTDMMSAKRRCLLWPCPLRRRRTNRNATSRRPPSNPPHSM